MGMARGEVDDGDARALILRVEADASPSHFCRFEEPMTEVLVRYNARIAGEDGNSYRPQVCGQPAGDGLWEGWIEFVSEDAPSLRSARETEQPNRDALIYWAQGLTMTYLEGALNRTLAPRVVTVPAEEPPTPSLFPGPARARRSLITPDARPVLDPFTTFAEGEKLLRGQLAALSRDHLVNIVRAYRLDVPQPYAATSAELIDGIVAAVRRQMG